MSGSPLLLTTLGGASLSVDGAIRLRAGKPLALLAYLALSPGRSATREFLLDLLWDDLDHERGRHALRQTVWQLRQQLGDGVVSGREELTLNAPVESDRDRFFAAVERGDLEAAYDAYRGDFLPDFALPGSVAFEHWADIERSRFRATFLRVAEMLARRRLGSGRFREAQDIARRMRDADRTNETGWRLLLEAQLAGRDLVQASVEADALRAVLAAEGRAPEPATRSLLVELQKAQGMLPAAPEGADPTLTAELVGREREFSLLIESWAAAQRGPSRHVHLSAPAGLGKTRLLADLAHRLEAMGAQVVSLRANPGDRTVPYSFAGDLARGLGGLPGLGAVSPATAEALVGLSPALSSRFPNARPLRQTAELLRLRIAALAEAVTEVAAERPLALLIDDAHWLDSESHQALDGILHRLDRSAVLVVTTGRPHAGRTLERAGTALLELEPLDCDAVGALFLALARLPDYGLASRIVEGLWRGSGGSPLLVLETLQLVMERGHLKREDDRWVVVNPEALLSGLDHGQVLAARLADLDSQARWVLLLLATMGTPATPHELRAGIRDPGDLEEHLWRLERKGLVHRRSESWEAAHDEIAAATLDSEPAERRQAAHGAVGRILLASAGVPDVALEAGRHFVAARDQAGLQLAFRGAVDAARRVGDPRGLPALAAAALGERVPTREAQRLVRSLPLTTRLGLRSPAMVGGLTMVAVVTVLGVSWAVSNPTDDPVARLAIVRDADGLPGAVQLGEVRVDPSSWQIGSPLSLRGVTTVRDTLLARLVHGADIGWSDGRLVFGVQVDNERTTDVFIHEGGRSRPAAAGPRDDGLARWSPSGQALLFSTARYSDRGADDYDLAILDPGSGDLRRLTATADHDVRGAWAPHGGLIAFVRGYRDLRYRELCWVTLDAAASRCLALPAGEPAEVIGWVDARRVLYRVDQTPGTGLHLWDIETDGFQPVWSGRVSAASVSPDGEWVACFCAEVTAERDQWRVFPLRDPGAWRAIRDSGVRSVNWKLESRRARAQVASVRIDRRALGVPRGSTQRIGASVLDAQGTELPFPAGALRWSTGDPAIARVDSLRGLVTGGLTGRTMLRVSAGPGLADSIEVMVSEHSTMTVIAETWEVFDSARWVPYGVPRPRLDRAPDGTPGLNNGGDGSYASGAYWHELLDPAQGLGVEASLSMPVNRSQWQTLSVAFATPGNFPVERWDRVTGGATPNGTSAANGQCSLQYPSGEGMVAAGFAVLNVGPSSRLLAVDSTWRTGAWRRVLVQLFPDGTCGFAVDGRPVWRSVARVATGERFRLTLGGNSAGTSMIVGPLTVWRGVRHDLTWPEPGGGVVRGQ